MTFPMCQKCTPFAWLVWDHLPVIYIFQCHMSWLCSKTWITEFGSETLQFMSKSLQCTKKVSYINGEPLELLPDMLARLAQGGTTANHRHLGDNAELKRICAKVAIGDLDSVDEEAPSKTSDDLMFVVWKMYTLNTWFHTNRGTMYSLCSFFHTANVI